MLVFEKYTDADIIFGNVTVPEGTNSLKGIIPWHDAENLWFIGQRSMGKRLLGIGANMAFRRMAFDKVWGFDECLGPGTALSASEDWDFAYRALRNGLKIFDTSSFSVAFRNFEETIKLLKDYDLTTAAFFYKNFRCGDISAAWVGLYVTILKAYMRIKFAMHRKLSGTPRIIYAIRIIYYVLYIQYLQTLIGIYNVMKYNINKKRCLFVSK